MRLSNHNFRTRIIVLILSAVLLPSITFCAVSYYRESNALYLAGFQLLEATTKHCANDINQWLNDQKTTVKLLSISPPLIHANVLALKYQANTPQNKEGIKRLNKIGMLLEGQETWIGEVRFSQLNTNQVYFSTKPHAKGESFVPGIALSAAQKETLRQGQVLISQISNTHIKNEIGGSTGYFSVYIWHKNKPLAIMTVRVLPGSLKQALVHSNVSLIDRSGHMLYEQNISDEKIKSAVANGVNLSHTTTSSLPEATPAVAHTRLTDPFGQPIAPLREMAASKRGEPYRNVLLDGYPNSKGDRMLGAWVEIPELGWYVLTEQPEEAFFAPLRSALFDTVALSLTVSTLFCLVAVWLARSLTTPLAQLSNIALSLAAGNRTVRCHWKRLDEIGVFATAFDKMADSIQAAMDQLESARDKALAANLAKSRFLANMSHELRTPLNAIIGYSEMIIEDAEYSHSPLGPKVSEIHIAALNLLGLINDILDLSKIEAGKMTIFIERFPLQDFLLELQSTVAPLAAAHNIELQFSQSEQIHTLYSDRTKLRQVLFNLIRNSIKYTSHQAASGIGDDAKNATISLEVLDKETELCFIVKDNGQGMNAEKLAVARLGAANTSTPPEHPYKSAGLGLTIVARFLKMIGGYYQIDSQEGQGTTVQVFVPKDVKAFAKSSSSHPDNPAIISANLSPLNSREGK